MQKLTASLQMFRLLMILCLVLLNYYAFCKDVFLTPIYVNMSKKISFAKWLICRMELVVVFLVLVAISCQPTYSLDGISHSKDSSSQHPNHYNIILIGATGNLASKYLWKALFELFRQRFSKNEALFHFYGGARQEKDVGQRIMDDIFLNVIKCSDDDCREKQMKFVESSQYLRLTVEQDFQVYIQVISKQILLFISPKLYICIN